MVAAHVFVENLDAPLVDEADRHHLERVLRLRTGESVTASDGAGGVRDCVVRDGLVLEPVGDTVMEHRPAPPIAIGFALTKGERPEWVVQKLTELGVDTIVPFAARRSVVRWEADKATRNATRLGRVAREAAMQSRRAWLPVIAPLTNFADLIGPGVAVAERDGGPPTLDRPRVLIGPEGGWAPEELAAAPATVGLGPTVLRAETAAIAAGVVLTALRAHSVGDMSDSPRRTRSNGEKFSR